MNKKENTRDDDTISFQVLVFIVEEDNDIPTTLLASNLKPMTSILARINLVMILFVK